MVDNLEIIEKEWLEHHVGELCHRGWRYVTITCCNNKDGSFDLFYTFDLNLKLRNMKLTVFKGDTVPSISGIVLAAAFAENEIGELFGLKFEGLVLDYGGRFMIAEGAPSEPFGKGLIVVDKDGGKA